MNRGVRYCARLLGSLCPAYHVPGSSERVEQSGFGHADELDVACPEFAPEDVRARVPGESGVMQLMHHGQVTWRRVHTLRSF